MELSVEVAVRRPRRAEQQSRVPQLVASMKDTIISWLCYFFGSSPALTFHPWCQGQSDLFLLLLIRLKTSTDTSEVQTKLTVGLVPQCCILTLSGRHAKSSYTYHASVLPTLLDVLVRDEGKLHMSVARTIPGLLSAWVSTNGLCCSSR